MPIKELAKQFGKDVLMHKISGGERQRLGRHQGHHHHHGQGHHHQGHHGYYRHGKATVGQALHEALKLAKHKGEGIKIEFNKILIINLFLRSSQG